MNKIRKNNTTKSLDTRFSYISKRPLYSQGVFKNIFEEGGLGEKSRAALKASFGKEAWTNGKAFEALGSIGNSLGTIVEAGVSNGQIADTSGIQDNIDDFENTQAELSSKDALLNQWTNTDFLDQEYSFSDIRGKTGWGLAGNTLTATASGLATGAQVGGPWGAVAGAAIGLGSGLIGLFAGDSKARAEQARLEEEARKANVQASNTFAAAARSLDKRDFINEMKNYSANGGPIAHMFSNGGYLGSTHGSDFTNGVMHINTGGTHEKNPNEGVQIGIAPDGTPNLVEEGEVIFNDYVYSNRLYAKGGELKKYNLPEKYDHWTIAKIANELSKESEERANDPISREGLTIMMDRLKNLQEAQKARKDVQKIRQILSQMPIEDQMGLTQEPAPAPTGIKETAQQETSSLAVGDNLQNNYSPEQITEQGITDNRASAEPTEEFAEGGLFNAVRIGAPIAGNLLGLALNKRDYTPIEEFEEATRNPNTVTFNPVSGSLEPEYISEQEFTNPIFNMSAGTRRALTSSSAGNVGALTNALLANDRQMYQALGDAALRARQYNYGINKDVYTTRMQRDQYNSTGSMQAQQFNSQMLNNWLYNRAMATMKARATENAAYNKAVSEGLTALFNNVSKAGKDLYNKTLAEKNKTTPKD